MATKYRDEDELDDDRDSEAEMELVEEDEFEDEAPPKPKVKIRAVVEEAEEDEVSAPKTKKIAAKKVESRDVEEEAPKPKRKVVKAKGQKGGKATMKTVKKAAARTAKPTDRPYGLTSLIGKFWTKFISKEGLPVKWAKKMCEEHKKAKTPAYWTLTDLRRGTWTTAAGIWRWDVNEEDGVMYGSNVRLKAAKAA